MSERQSDGWVPPPMGGYQARPPLPAFPENRHVREGGAGSGWPLFILILAMGVGFCFGVAYGLSKCHPKPRPRAEPEPTYYHAMTRKEVLDIASSGYSEPDLMERLYDDEGEYNDNETGDTLALFCVREIIDTYDSKLDDDDQLEHAASAMRTAAREVDGVADALLNHDTTSTS